MQLLRAGDVFEIASGKRQGHYTVIEAAGSERQPRVLALSADRRVVRMGPAELRASATPVGRIALPSGFDPRDENQRRRLAGRMAHFEAREPRPRRAAARRRARIESHPCHGCPEIGRHLHFLRRAARLEREIAGLNRRIKGRTGTLARRFERVLEVLEQLGYVRDWVLTPKGEALAHVYNEADLLVVEALERGVFDSLDASGLAAALSAVVYEPRGPEPEAASSMPTAATHRVWTRLIDLWEAIRGEEEARDLDLTREPDAGFAERAYLWASGASLEDVLEPGDAPGDFVRATKQLIDLLRQIEEVAPARLATVRESIERLHRGVVAYSSLL
jgi:ATP-dependent RNA helicase HelY